MSHTTYIPPPPLAIIVVVIMEAPIDAGDGVGVATPGPEVSLRRCAKARLNSRVGLTGWSERVG